MAQKFVSNRDVSIYSVKHGRSYQFKKGVPREDVIPGMHQDLLNAGILPCDDEGKKVEATEVVVAVEPAIKIALPPEDGDERKKVILAALKAICDRNAPGDFTGGNMPKAAVVTQILGWRVDTKDVSEIWKDHKADLLKDK